MIIKRQALWALLCAALAGTAAHAGKNEDCPPGTFLTITGKIKRFTDPAKKVYRFSEADFLRLSAKTISTSSEWTPVSKWTGPSLKDVLDVPGLDPSATTLRPIALDEFASSIPLTDLATYNPLIAHSRDGKRLHDAKYGPMFIVYPRDQHRELQNPASEAKLVWALCKIEVL